MHYRNVNFCYFDRSVFHSTFWGNENSNKNIFVFYSNLIRDTFEGSFLNIQSAPVMLQDNWLVLAPVDGAIESDWTCRLKSRVGILKLEKNMLTFKSKSRPFLIWFIRPDLKKVKL